MDLYAWFPSGLATEGGTEYTFWRYLGNSRFGAERMNE